MNILIVDDEASIRFALKELFISNNYYAIESANGEEALDILKNENIDVAIIDYQLPGINGLDLLDFIKKNYNSIEVIFITAFGNEETAITAIKKGAYDYVAKPFNNEELINRINHISDTLENKNRNIDYKYGYYYSPVMKSIVEKVKTIAKTDVPVLITGESGTGKELIAKLIHYHSGLKGKYVAVNCSALPSTLIESELFGAEKGSYTGSFKEKIGFFELADKGTIFLDEIGDMPVELQAKLLRTLQEGEINRIGGNTPIKIDARVIAATNAYIESMVEENKFREDLFYRLNGIRINLPPLRERKDEIKYLAHSFLNEFNIKYNKSIKGFEEDTIKLLSGYEWQGNIRELKSKIEEAVIFCNSEWISVNCFSINNEKVYNKKKDLDKTLKENLKPVIQFLNIENLPKRITEAKKDIIDVFEKEFILYYLCKNNWKVAKTADEIGLYRQDLYKKIKKLGIGKINNL